MGYFPPGNKSPQQTFEFVQSAAAAKPLQLGCQQPHSYSDTQQRCTWQLGTAKSSRFTMLWKKTKFVLKKPWWLMSNLREEYIDAVLITALVSVLFSIYCLKICFFGVCPFLPVLVNTESMQTRLEANYKGNIKTDCFQSS